MVLLPAQIEVTSLSQVVLPVVAAGGKLALAFVDHRHHRRHLRRRSGDHAVLRLHAGPVLRLGMGQVPARPPRRPGSTPS